MFLLEEGFISAYLWNAPRWFCFILYGSYVVLYSCRVILFLFELLIRDRGHGQSLLVVCIYRYCFSG